MGQGTEMTHKNKESRKEPGKDGGKGCVMVNFICQVVRVVVPRYLVKHQSKCHCEDFSFFLFFFFKDMTHI